MNMLNIDFNVANIEFTVMAQEEYGYVETAFGVDQNVKVDGYLNINLLSGYSSGGANTLEPCGGDLEPLNVLPINFVELGGSTGNYNTILDKR